MKAVILALAVVLGLALARPFQFFDRRTPEPTDIPHNTITGYFSNRVDHFNLSSTSTYSQRYWYIEDYWRPQDGPAILYIQGEAPGQIVGSRTMPLELAQELHAKLFALEHRFYGVSQPCKDWSLDCLRLLNHHQAMADIANFIENKTKEMGNPDRKWVIVGGSYAGALVGWFKSKYPHLVEVAYSSSGVINAVVDYKMYMQQINMDLKKDQLCYMSVIDMNTYATNTILRGSEEDKAKLKKAMEATMLDDLDFLQYFTDIYVGELQYSTRKTVCPKIIKVSMEKDMLKRMALYAELARSLGQHPSDYLYEKEMDIKIDVHSSARQWNYQVCSSLGYFQTGDTNNPTRTPALNLEYWKRTCKKIFGTDLFPDEGYTNGITGDLRIPPLLKQTIFVNGGDDPWQWAGVRDEKLTNDDLLVTIVKCDDCAHCIDLYKPSPDDPKALTDARQAIKKRIKKWMKVDEESAVTYADQ